jgi:hypothetical protein
MPVTRRVPLLALRASWRGKLARVVEEAASRVLEPRLAEAEQRATQRHEQLLEAMRIWDRRQRRDVFTALDQEAARTSAELLRTELQSAALHGSPHQTLRHALNQAPEHGMALEFGVASGTTLAIIAEQRSGAVFGFDSFKGLPERWRLGFDAGEFALQTPPNVPGAELVVGLFMDTLPGFLAEHPGPVAFTSTATCTTPPAPSWNCSGRVWSRGR